MCVIMAKKCKLKNSNKENWFLYKVRDRNYDPVYNLEVIEKGNTETLFLTDKGTMWSEGVNSKGIMIVSAALNNAADVDDNGTADDGKSVIKGPSQTEILKKAMQENTLKGAIKIIIDGLFVGTTFISDGDKAVAVEIYIQQEFFDRFVDEYGEDKFEKLSHNDQAQLVAKHAKKENYDVKQEEITGHIDVRTNHGKLIPTAGFQKTDDNIAGWKSSTARLDAVNNAMKPLSVSSHPFEVLTILKNLNSVYKKRGHNPIRLKKNKANETSYYSSTIVMCTPTGTLFAVPLDSTVEDLRKLSVKKERSVDFVMLPKNLPLFESFRSKIIIKENNL